MGIYCDTPQATLEAMRQKLAAVVPDAELRAKAELVFEINRLKVERNAVILGHNYMEPALFHTVADIVGDSLELARAAVSVDRDPIVFCGVRFMAETAKILNPNKTVLLPGKDAGCSLADSINASDMRELRARYPQAPIVSYINVYADVKAEADVVCTSGNAEKIIRALAKDVIVFVPDEYLARNVALRSGKRIVPAKENGVWQPAEGKNLLVIWRGRCEVHARFTSEDVADIRKWFPDSDVLAHPECRPEVAQAADYAGGTSGMIEYVRSSGAARFALFTESAMAGNIEAEVPGKKAVRLCDLRCPHMQEITLEDTLHALRRNEEVIEVPPETRVRAKRALERMLELS